VVTCKQPARRSLSEPSAAKSVAGVASSAASVPSLSWLLVLLGAKETSYETKISQSHIFCQSEKFPDHSTHSSLHFQLKRICKKFEDFSIRFL
jgi:hypothetical protein